EGDRSASPEGPSGDCYAFVQIQPHPIFRREGQNLVCRLPIGFAQATLGAEIEIPTLDGPEKITIPPGTQNGAVIRVKGRGLPTPRLNLVGDLLAHCYIEVPTKVEPERAALLRKLAEFEGGGVAKGAARGKWRRFLALLFPRADDSAER
ncbi:MAG: hypothetical protein HUK22_01090, partial [Thermoguttaceae bacterium]|nr:hypothetical protein [Thermoguttaceae bacterium]